MASISMRDEIADIIEGEMEYPVRERAEEYAQALVNEGYSKPRRITTTAELDSLGTGSVIVKYDENGKLFHTATRNRHGRWTAAGSEHESPSEAVWLDGWDVRVLLDVPRG